MNNLMSTLITCWGLTLFLTGCGGAGQPAVSSEAAAAGEQLYQEQGCIACHPLDPAAGRSLGPTMVEIANRSADTIQSPDYTGSAETVTGYLRESIVQPNVYLVDGYNPLMPQTYAASLAEVEIEQLIAYLLTLE